MVRVSTGLGKLCLILFMMTFIIPSIMAGAMSHAHQPSLDVMPVAVMADCHAVETSLADCCAEGMAETMGSGCAMACLSMAGGCMTAPALPMAALTLPVPNLSSLGHATVDAVFVSISGRPDTPPPKA